MVGSLLEGDVLRMTTSCFQGRREQVRCREGSDQVYIYERGGDGGMLVVLRWRGVNGERCGVCVKC